MKNGYEILEGTSPDELANEVANAIKAGMIPCGGLFVVNHPEYKQDIFYQAVCSTEALAVPMRNALITAMEESAREEERENAAHARRRKQT